MLCVVGCFNAQQFNFLNVNFWEIFAAIKRRRVGEEESRAPPKPKILFAPLVRHEARPSFFSIISIIPQKHVHIDVLIFYFEFLRYTCIYQFSVYMLICTLLIDMCPFASLNDLQVEWYQRFWKVKILNSTVLCKREKHVLYTKKNYELININ